MENKILAIINWIQEYYRLRAWGKLYGLSPRWYWGNKALSNRITLKLKRPSFQPFTADSIYSALNEMGVEAIIESDGSRAHVEVTVRSQEDKKLAEEYLYNNKPAGISSSFIVDPNMINKKQGKLFCWHDWHFILSNFTLGDKYQCRKCGKVKYD